MAELVDALVLGASIVRCASSSLALGIPILDFGFWILDFPNSQNLASRQLLINNYLQNNNEHRNYRSIFDAARIED